MASIEVLHPRERLLSTARDYAVALAGLWRPRSAAASPSTVMRTSPRSYQRGGAPLADLASRRVDTSLNQASRRVCRAMLLLAPLRDSQDPELRAAYENIHDVMGDLASIHHWNALAALRPVESGTVSED
jgi:hypothetical protein